MRTDNFKGIAIVSLALLLILTGCSSNSTITNSDQTEILKIAESYYSALEEKDYQKALSRLYPRTEGVRIFEIKNRSHALTEINYNLGYRIKLLEPPTKVMENVTVFVQGDKPDKSLWVVPCKVSIQYENNIVTIDEELYFKQDSNEWFIKKISSSDKYVLLRAFDYYYHLEDPLKGH